MFINFFCETLVLLCLLFVYNFSSEFTVSALGVLGRFLSMAYDVVRWEMLIEYKHK